MHVSGTGGDEEDGIGYVGRAQHSRPRHESLPLIRIERIPDRRVSGAGRDQGEPNPRILVLGHQRLVQAAIKAGIQVVPIPGASALLAALVASGLETDRFTFYGFLPRKGKERSATLDEIASSPHTAVLYEAPGRVADSLLELASRAGDRPAVVARELTKQFEELRRGTLESLSAYYSETPPRGEVVIVLAGAPLAAPDESALQDDARALRARGLSVRDVVGEHTKRGVARNLAYRIARTADGKDESS